MNTYVPYFDLDLNEAFEKSSRLFPGCHFGNVVNEIPLEPKRIFNVHELIRLIANYSPHLSFPSHESSRMT